MHIETLPLLTLLCQLNCCHANGICVLYLRIADGKHHISNAIVYGLKNGKANK